METLGDRLKLLRGKFSQAAIAERLGIPQTTWSNYEKNKNKPDFALLDLICREFEVSADWLLFGRGPKRPDYYADDEYTNGEPNEILVERLETQISGLVDKKVSNKQVYIDYKRMADELIHTQRMLIESQQERIEELRQYAKGGLYPTDAGASAPSAPSTSLTSDE